MQQIKKIFQSDRLKTHGKTAKEDENIIMEKSIMQKNQLVLLKNCTEKGRPYFEVIF
jgi:hypothetical protein